MIINVEDVKFETIEAGEWVMRVIITGTGFVQAARPIVGRVGNKPMAAVMPLYDKSGVVGFLENMPAPSDALAIGYMGMPLTETDFTFDPSIS